MPLSSCRISSGQASSKTLQRRTTQVRALTSEGDSSVQLQAEVRSLSKEQREELIGQAGLPIKIPTDQALAMKADLSLPWNKLRVISRYVMTYLHHHKIIK